MKDFNLVEYLKTNKLGSYGMINENYMDLKPVNNPMGEAEDFGFDTDDDEDKETPMTNASRMADLTDERALKQFKNAALFIAEDLEDEGFDTADIAEYLKQIILNVNLNEGEEATSGKKTFDGLNILALPQSGNDKDANIDAVEIYGDRIWLTYKIGKETERQSIMKTKFPATKGKGPIYVRFNLNGGNYDVSNISKVIYDSTGKLK
jgi:hypothetical protein